MELTPPLAKDDSLTLAVGQTKTINVDEFEYQISNQLGAQSTPAKVVVTTSCIDVKWQTESIIISQPAILEWTRHNSVSCSSTELNTLLTSVNNSKTFYFYQAEKKQINWVCRDINEQPLLELNTSIEILKLTAPSGLDIQK